MSGLSAHKVEVVTLWPSDFLPIPNADNIIVANVFGGYPCVVRKADVKGLMWAYVPPDSLVPVDRGPFTFLQGHSGESKINGRPYARVRSRRFRGQASFGLLLPAPPGAKPGDDLAKAWDILHYEPPAPVEPQVKKYGWVRRQALRMLQRPFARHYGPPVSVPYYDIESLRRYPEVFAPGEPVIVTEKIHGCNAAYVYIKPTWIERWLRGNAGIYIRSRTVWKRPGDGSVWNRALTPEMETWLRAHPGQVLFGEVYGPGVQNLTYGVDRPTFMAFDIYDRGLYALPPAGLPTVPVLYQGPYLFSAVAALAEGPSTLPRAQHVREGVVVRPVVEAVHPDIGRKILKIVGLGYYEKEK